MRKTFTVSLCILLAGMMPIHSVLAATAMVAVASNFLLPAKELAAQYQQQSGHDVKISGGSTGKLYAQIIHGAPFDVFFAANEREPQRLERQRQSVNGTRFTYALGQLAFFSSIRDLADADWHDILREDWSTVAIANARTAPYGKAAMEILHKTYGSRIPFRIVRGENVGQAYQYARSGNAQAGFVALSQLLADAGIKPGSYLIIPQDQYRAIAQQAVLLQRGQGNPAAEGFLQFMQTAEVGRLLEEKYGYAVPQTGTGNEAIP